MTRRLIYACLAVLCLPALQAHAETVRWGRAGDASTLDPHAAADGMTQQLVRNIYEPLVAREPDGRLTGKLAASWLMRADDPSVWVFNLRRAVFHNGAAFTADDVVFSYQRARAEQTAFHEAMADVISISAVDARSVAIRFAKPSPTLPVAVTNVLVIDREWAQANGAGTVRAPGTGDAPFTQRNANGTGAYSLQSREPQVRTKLVRNDRYHSPFPGGADTVIHLPIANPAMRAAALKRGEIDVLQDVAATEIENLGKVDDIEVAIAPANTILYLGYRFGQARPADASDSAEKNPFDDARVRHAIELAIDRNEVAAMVDHGHAGATAVLVPPFVNGWSRGLAAPSAPDMARARELLAEAGYADGFAAKLDVADGDAAAANRISSMLARLGIWADVVARPQIAHDAHLASGDSMFHLANHAAPGSDSAAVLDWLVHGTPGYSNDALASRVDALAAMPSGSARNAELASIWIAVQKERIALPVAQRVLAHAMRDTISLAVDPDNQTRFETIRFND